MEPDCGEDGPLVAGEAGVEGPVGDNYRQTFEGVPHDCNQDIRGMENEHTNNRLERVWRSCKDVLKLMSSGERTIVRAVNIIA